MYTLEVDNSCIELTSEYTFENPISPKDAFKFLMSMFFNWMDEGRYGIDLHDYVKEFNDDVKKESFTISLDRGNYVVTFSKLKTHDQTLRDFDQDWDESYDWINFE